MKTNPKNVDALRCGIACLVLILVTANVEAGPFDCYFKITVPCHAATYETWVCEDGPIGFERTTEGASRSRCTTFGINVNGGTDCLYLGAPPCYYTFTWHYCDGSGGTLDLYDMFSPNEEPGGEPCSR
jgi:hypothetical protein